jgi:hypothetical protein
MVNDTAVTSLDDDGLHVLELPKPFEPGDTLHVGFVYGASFPSGSTRNGGGVEQFVLPSGAVLHTLRRSFLPVPGIVPGIGAGPDRLPPSPPDTNAWRGTLPPAVGPGLPFTTRIEATAPAGWTVNATGVRIAERSDGSASTFVWASDVPVRALNVVAGRWEVNRREGVAVYYHKGHAENVDGIAAALAAARRRYAEWFHPCPWPELRISEFPNMVSNAQGFPSNISMSETSGFLIRQDGVAPPGFLVTAHEAAHQWWGNLLVPGDAPGADVLIEGMAHYAALLLHESELGPRARIDFAVRMEEQYGRRRRIGSERPLASAVDEGRQGEETVVYDKGAWVMWMLQQHLGREPMLAGLREFINRYRAPDDSDFPTVHDLMETLRPYAADPAGYQAFVDQWFHSVVLPEYRLRDVTVVPTGENWDVTAVVENIGTGFATIDVALQPGGRFPGDARQPAPAHLDSRQSVRIEPHRPVHLRWRVAFVPGRIVIDPDAMVLQLNRGMAVFGEFQDMAGPGTSRP